jgi:hypothetical protein
VNIVKGGGDKREGVRGVIEEKGGVKFRERGMGGRV